MLKSNSAQVWSENKYPFSLVLKIPKHLNIANSPFSKQLNGGGGRVALILRDKVMH